MSANGAYLLIVSKNQNDQGILSHLQLPIKEIRSYAYTICSTLRKECELIESQQDREAGDLGRAPDSLRNLCMRLVRQHVDNSYQEGGTFHHRLVQKAKDTTELPMNLYSEIHPGLPPQIPAWKNEYLLLKFNPVCWRYR